MPTKSNIRHSSAECRWGTPREIVDIARAVLGLRRNGDRDAAISVDPFSEPAFNEQVGARRILTGEAGLDGFRDRWLDVDSAPRADHVLAGMARAPDYLNEDTALVNPPGDDRGENAPRAYTIAVRVWSSGWLGAGVVWVAFNLNQLQTLQRSGVASPLAGPRFVRCVPNHRLDFVACDGRKAESPSHPCWFMLMPHHDQQVAAEQVRLFESMASKLGDVW